MYRGPKPSIPDFKGDPREFARLKIALDNLLPANATEWFKYQILVDHLKFEDALLIADLYTNSVKPYTDTMASLTEHYGQPHQLAMRRIANLMEAPSIQSHDTAAFKRFALRVRALVGMLEQLGEKGDAELQCGSHVTRLMSKLPQNLRSEFMRYLQPSHIQIPTLLDFSTWLESEIKIQEYGAGITYREEGDSKNGETTRWRDVKTGRPTYAHHNTEQIPSYPASPEPIRTGPNSQGQTVRSCPYCPDAQHHLNQCTDFSQLNTKQRTSGIRTARWCWRCGLSHMAAQCRLETRCKICDRCHLDALHDLNNNQASESTTQENTYLVSSANNALCG